MEGAGRRPNPFESAQRDGRDPTVKWCLYEVLATHYASTGARVADLQKDERLLELRPKMRAAKNLNGQITGELGSDKGVHFIKDFKGQPGYWGVRLDVPGEQPAAGQRPAAGNAAEAQQQGAGGEAAPPPQDPQQDPQQQQEQEQHPAAQPKQAARKVPMPSPLVPGNESEAAPWAGATCQYLTDRLWKKGVAVWWPAEQQYFNGKIIETLSEEGADLLLLHVLYDDQTDEWMRPTRFKVSGGKDHTVVVITENEVYIRDEASGRLVPDPNQGVDPAALGGSEATAGASGAAPGSGAGAAAEAAVGKPVAALQQQPAQQPAAPSQQAQQAAPPQQAQQAHQQQQQPVKSATSRSSEARSGRKPHAARAPGDIPTKGSWWQKAVVDEARALEIQKQQSSASEEHPCSPVAAAGGAQQAQQAQQEGQRLQQQHAQAGSMQAEQPPKAPPGSVQAEQSPAAQQGQQQAQQAQGQQQERKRKLPAEEAAAERPQHGKPQQAQQVQQARQQRPLEQQPAEKRQRRESSAAEEQAQQQRRQAQGGEKPGKASMLQSAAPAGPKFFSIPKRPEAEQPPPPPPKQQAGGPADGGTAKGPGGSMPFRIPKTAVGPPVAAPASAGAASAERQGGKRSRESLEAPADQRRAPQPQGRTEAERGQRAQQQQQQQQQQHAIPLQQTQQQHAQQHQQHAAPPQQEQQHQHSLQRQPQRQPQTEQQQRQPRGRSPEAVRREERDTRELILRNCQADAYRRMGQVRWATPAEHAELPTPRGEPGAAAAVAALLAPHKAALSERLAANGPWPHGAALLPERGSAAAAAAGTLAAAPAQPPEEAQFGRIFVCKRNTTSACFKRNVFVSNSDIDLHGLHPGSLALLHSLDEKLVYGFFRVVELGTNLDPGFPAEAAFKYHVRVQPLHLFQPVPDMLLDTFVERKIHPKTGKRMKFFDRHLDARQCRQIWSLMHFYNEKLHDSWDCLWRLSPLTPAGAGFYEALARQEAARAGGGGGQQQAA